MNQSPWIARIALSILVGVAAVSGEAGAQNAPAFGIASESSVVINAWDLQPTNSGTTWADTAFANRYATNGAFNGVFRAGVSLPNGALILRIELEGCDNSVEGGVAVALFRSGPANELAAFGTDDAGAPGCGRFGATLITPETVDNSASRYYVEAATTAYEGTASLGAVRVYYQLQVSPAPLAPTFLDVPNGDPAYQFVEALVAAGITAGCGGGNYCPDAFLTRRQMAVFISKALGLHWPDLPPIDVSGR